MSSEAYRFINIISNQDFEVFLNYLHFLIKQNKTKNKNNKKILNLFF